MKKIILSLIFIGSLSFPTFASNGNDSAYDWTSFDVQLYCGTFDVELSVGFATVKFKATVCCTTTIYTTFAGCSVDIGDDNPLPPGTTLEDIINALCAQYNVNCGTVTSATVISSSVGQVTDGAGGVVGNYRVKEGTYSIDKNVLGWQLSVEVEEAPR